MMKKLILCIILLIILGTNIFAQAAATAKTTWDAEEFPLWAHDIRRAEIILFGSFPFAWFTTTFILDIYRSATHEWDNKYFPWPLKPAGAVELTTDEWMTSIYGAAALSVGVAVADYIITQIARKKQIVEESRWTEGDPIIIRKPLNEYTAPPPVEDNPSKPPPNTSGSP
jgi:hypothetical protein